MRSLHAVAVRLRSDLIFIKHHIPHTQNHRASPPVRCPLKDIDAALGASGTSPAQLPAPPRNTSYPRTPTPLNALFDLDPSSKGHKWPPATRPPSKTTGTFPQRNQSDIGAPVTICTGPAWPSTLTWHTTSLSASGGAPLRDLPTIFQFLSRQVKPPPCPCQRQVSVYS